MRDYILKEGPRINTSPPKGIVGSCECGFRSDVMINLGRWAYEKGSFYFPCYCNLCKDMVKVNLSDETPNCPNCRSDNFIPYNEKRLIGVKRNFTIYNRFSKSMNKSIEITNSTYKCPKCNEMKLRFHQNFIRQID